MGPFPRGYAFSGKYSRQFFDGHGRLRRIKGIGHWSLEHVLCEKYNTEKRIAAVFSQGLEKMLQLNPLSRSSALDCLKEKWLKL